MSAKTMKIVIGVLAVALVIVGGLDVYKRQEPPQSRRAPGHRVGDGPRGPVSYTHLDVYKRQVPILFMFIDLFSLRKPFVPR